MTYVRLRERCLQQVREPSVGLLFAHPAAEVELVKIAVRLAAQRTQLAVCQSADGSARSRVCADICIARRITLADIEHGAVGVFSRRCGE